MDLMVYKVFNTKVNSKQDSREKFTSKLENFLSMFQIFLIYSSKSKNR